MRLFQLLLFMFLLLAMLWFVIDNIDNRTGFTLMGKHYPDVALYFIVFGAVFAGILFVGLIAVVEGAHDRLANRKLKREIQKLETELNFLRTQPVGSPRREPDQLPDRSGQAAERTAGQGRDDVPASAPIYEPDQDSWDPDDDDDIYSGGRAV